MGYRQVITVHQRSLTETRQAILKFVRRTKASFTHPHPLLRTVFFCPQITMPDKTSLDPLIQCLVLNLSHPTDRKDQTMEQNVLFHPIINYAKHCLNLWLDFYIIGL
ncbi:hypothetical protein RRG08_058927 [Elysia crispata]|uniref:Uncharacterized protein n=1 Tax=Elysia crispata TaxID=231223 RepID=A0AAE0XRI0_9GAST|nr:hypothetical protein RRG08_058927 [Elysia crispata]